MFKKVLYPTDFSDCATKALEYVKKLREAGTEEVVLVHVIDVREIEAMTTGVAALGMTTTEYEEALQKKMRDEIKDKINDTWARREEIDLNESKERIQLGPLDLYAYLPKTNCGECGERTCMAFAMKVLNEGKKLSDCPVLAEDKYRGARDTLVSLLESAGYTIF